MGGTTVTTVLILALLAVGLALVVAEAHLAAYGTLAAVGVAALVAAVVVAVAASGGSVALALAIAVPLGVATAAVGMLGLRKAIAVSRTRPRGGADGLIGKVGVVRQPLDPVGQIAVGGELWRAQLHWADDEDEPPPAEGDRVVVDRVQGLTLTVRRAESWEVEP
jgi:membrane-bound serine protease (ClpP class)